MKIPFRIKNDDVPAAIVGKVIASAEWIKTNDWQDHLRLSFSDGQILRLGSYGYEDSVIVCQCFKSHEEEITCYPES